MDMRDWAAGWGLVGVGSAGYNHIFGTLPRNQARLRIGSTKPKTHQSLYITGSDASRAGIAPEPGKDRVTHSDEHRTTGSVGDNRLRLIRQRLRSDFYEVPPASECIAASVMAELKDSEESASALPH